MNFSYDQNINWTSASSNTYAVQLAQIQRQLASKPAVAKPKTAIDWLRGRVAEITALAFEEVSA